MKTIITADTDLNARYTMTRQEDPHSPTGVFYDVWDHLTGKRDGFADWNDADRHIAHLRREQAPHGQLIHYFSSTGEAYDATQCRDSVVDGDILVIASERVVGLAHCWPLAVTEERGHLHHPEERWTESGYGPANADLKFSIDQVSRALKVAAELGIGRLYTVPN